MVCPQARKHLEPQEAGRGRKEAPLEVLERAQPADPLTADLCPSTTVRIIGCCFKPSGLWCLRQP